MTWTSAIPILLGCVVYWAIIVWLLWPALTRPSEARNNKIRIGFGLYMLGTVLLPFLGAPFIILGILTRVHPFLLAPLHTKYLIAAAYAQIDNVHRLKTGTALTIEVEYAIDVAGKRHKAINKFQCFQKRSVSRITDRAIGSMLMGEVRTFANRTIAIGPPLHMKLPGGETISAENKQSLCRVLQNSGWEVGKPIVKKWPDETRIYLVDGVGKQTHIIEFYVVNQALSHDVISVFPPVLKSVRKVQARDIIDLREMSPFPVQGETTQMPPAIKEAMSNVHVIRKSVRR